MALDNEASAGEWTDQNDPWSVNRFLNAFPKNLPFVAEQRPILRDNARHGLVVFRQIHWSDHDLSEEALQQLEECQQQLYAMFDRLIEDTRIRMRAIYSEGMMARGEPKAKPSLLRTDEGKRAWDAAPPLVAYGADYVLYNEKRLQLKGAERTKEYEESGKSIQNGWKNAKKEVFRDREDALLGIVAQEDDRIAYTMFGAAHCWRDNVRRWNKKYADDVFSLLTITPEAVSRYIDGDVSV